MQKLRRLTGHGAAVAGQANLIFVQLCQRNQPRSKEGTMPFSFKNQPYLRHTIAGAFAARFSPQ
jgi:hypothetical protein